MGTVPNIRVHVEGLDTLQAMIRHLEEAATRLTEAVKACSELADTLQGVHEATEPLDEVAILTEGGLPLATEEEIRAGTNTIMPMTPSGPIPTQREAEAEPLRDPCPDCGGSGGYSTGATWSEFVKCDRCSGLGLIL